MTNKSHEVLLPSAARTTSVTTEEFVMSSKAKGMRLFLNISATSGTAPTLDIKVQMKDSLSGEWVDQYLAAFSQKTANVRDVLTIYPGISAVANTKISDFGARIYRVVATIGGTTPSFTFSLNAEYLP